VEKLLSKATSKMYDVIIIGSGPAGLTAGLYASREKLNTLLIAGFAWGGQLMLTTEVENYPGFKEGIYGSELISQMWKQAERFGCVFIFEDSTSVDFSNPPFRVTVGEKTYQGKAIIIASGASPRWLGLESETRLRGRGVSICATCDAAFFTEKSAVVVGGGDSALEEALALSKHARDVKIIHRRDSFRASKILQEHALENPNISVIWNSVVLEILGTDLVKGIRIQEVNSKKESVLTCDAVFIAIGHKPNTDIFRGQIKLDEKGYVITKNEVQTNIKGVFVAGDVYDQQYRQAITAAASGCKAALQVEKYLGEVKYTHGSRVL
jgi:thioredoxin reductase (NADPH)